MFPELGVDSPSTGGTWDLSTQSKGDEKQFLLIYNVNVFFFFSSKYDLAKHIGVFQKQERRTKFKVNV